MPINNLLDQVKKTEYFIKDIHPTEFFDKKNYDIVKVIKNNFPELKIIAKGDRILVNGDEVLINTLINRLDTLVVLINQNIKINNKSIDLVLSGKGNKLIQLMEKRIILFGNGKKEIKAHTVNQIKIVESFDKNDMVFAIGPAGTGKTYTGIAVAVKALKDRLVKKLF